MEKKEPGDGWTQDAGRCDFANGNVKTTAKVDVAKVGCVGEAPLRAEQTLSTAPHGRDEKVVWLETEVQQLRVKQSVTFDQVLLDEAWMTVSGRDTAVSRVIFSQTAYECEEAF